MTGLSIDDYLERVGTMGRFQLRLLALLSFLQFRGGLQVFLMTFITAEPGWTCATNSSVCNLTGTHYPGRGDYDYRCDKEIPRGEWRFDDSYTSIVTEWDLVCGRSILGSVATSMIFGGWLVGAIFFGWVSDRFGRRKVLYFGTAVGAVGAMVSPFLPDFWLYAGSRLLGGFVEGGAGLCSFILMTEFTGVQYRHAAGAYMFYFWSLAPMLLALCAWGIRGWKILAAVVSAPSLLCLGFWWFLPESARWLLVSGRVVEAESMLQKIAQVNRKEVPEERLALHEDSAAEQEQNVADFRDLFRTRAMVHRTLVCWFAWAVVAMVYYGVSLSAATIAGNLYLNVFLTGLIELPGNFCAIYSSKKFGRKKTVVAPLLLAALCAAANVVLSMDFDGKGGETDSGTATGYTAGQVITAVMAKFFITITFNTIYIYSAELFPTVIRNIGMGTSSAAGRIGSFSSSYIIWLTRVHPLIPYGIMGVAAFVAGILCCSLPETKGEPTAETVGSVEMCQMPDSSRVHDEGEKTNILPQAV